MNYLEVKWIFLLCGYMNILSYKTNSIKTTPTSRQLLKDWKSILMSSCNTFAKIRRHWNSRFNEPLRLEAGGKKSRIDTNALTTWPNKQATNKPPHPKTGEKKSLIETNGLTTWPKKKNQQTSSPEGWRKEKLIESNTLTTDQTNNQPTSLLVRRKEKFIRLKGKRRTKSS